MPAQRFSSQSPVMAMMHTGAQFNSMPKPFQPMPFGGRTPIRPVSEVALNRDFERAKDYISKLNDGGDQRPYSAMDALKTANGSGGGERIARE